MIEFLITCVDSELRKTLRASFHHAHYLDLDHELSKTLRALFHHAHFLDLDHASDHEETQGRGLRSLSYDLWGASRWR